MRYLLSESGASAVRAIASRRGGVGSETRDPPQLGILADTFSVELRTLAGLRWIRVYIPNRAGLVKLDGATVQSASGILNGWHNVAVFGGVQTIVYLELDDSNSTGSGSTGVSWSLVARTSAAPTPTGSALVLPSVMIARIDANGTVHQLHAGALVLSTHYLVRGMGDTGRLLNRRGETIATIDGTGAIAFAHGVSVTGEIDASGGISAATGIRIGGSLYAPTRISTGEIVLAKQ